MFKLEEFATVFSGVPAKESSNGSASIMRLADLTEVRAGRVPRMARGNPPGVARALPIEEGDLVVAARGRSTDICMAQGSIFGAYISLDLYLVRPQAERINSEYLRAVLELPETQAILSSEKQGSGLARLPKEALERIAIPVPPLRRQRLIAELAVSLEEERNLLRRLAGLKALLAHEVLGRVITDRKTNISWRSA